MIKWNTYIPNKLEGSGEVCLGLVQVNEVHTVNMAVDKRPHVWIPHPSLHQ